MTPRPLGAPVGRPVGALTRLKPKKYRVTKEDIALAMVTCDHKRREAAKMLGINLNSLNGRIHSNPFLRDQFSAGKLNLREKLKAAKAEKDANEVSLLNRVAEEMVVSQSHMASMITTRLTDIRERLKFGQEARALQAEDPETLSDEQRRYIARYGLAVDVNGNPVEEKMLLAQEAAMLREHHDICLAVATISHKKAVTEAIMRKLGGGGRERGKPGLGSTPKGIKPITGNTTHITDSQVIIQAPTPAENGG